MGVTGVSHVPVQVRDIDASLRFYRDFLGMTVSVDLEETHERFNIHRRGVYLRWLDQPRAPFVVLGCPLNREQTGEPLPLFSVGIDHIGFFVDDIASFIERAATMGVGRLGAAGPAGLQAPLAYGDEGTGHVKSVIFIDPDGVHVQLDQWCDETAETSGAHAHWTASATAATST